MNKIKYKRIIVLILDSVGCGYLPDYKKFNNNHSNTLLNLYKNKKSFSLPNLEKLGFAKLVHRKNEDFFMVGKMKQRSMGNDTFAGVSEMLGYVIKKRFRSKKEGFLKKTIKKIESLIKCGIIGNEYISGFKALDKYYVKHKKENSLILYLADDGVVLLAAHEDVIKPHKLNIYGKKLASLLAGENISRVITRPFIGLLGSFVRTDKRKDFLAHPEYQKKLIVNKLLKRGVDFVTTEHLNNLIGRQSGVKYFKGNLNNKELVKVFIESLSKNKNNSVMTLCFQDFDMFGHKKDPDGYRKCLMQFDSMIPKILKKLMKNDLLIITADHGCDPYADVRGHTREYVPLIVYSKLIKKRNVYLGTRDTFADIGKTICYNFNLQIHLDGDVIYEIF